MVSLWRCRSRTKLVSIFARDSAFSMGFAEEGGMPLARDAAALGTGFEFDFRIRG